MNTYARTALSAVGLLAFLAMWEALPRLGLLDTILVPPPSAIPAAFIREVKSGIWLRAVTDSP